MGGVRGIEMGLEHCREPRIMNVNLEGIRRRQLKGRGGMCEIAVQLAVEITN